jgi:hypothetical protein
MIDNICGIALVDNEAPDNSLTQNQARLMTKNRLFASLTLALAISFPLTPAAADGSVSISTFTSGVNNGEPVDYRQEFFNDTSVVFYYSELLGLKGQTVRHRWSLEGKAMQEVMIDVTHPRQAVWSKSVMRPDWTGNWTVEVVDKAGNILNRSNFAYNPN